jgi:predicted alpha/beta superfamily hydrolase
MTEEYGHTLTGDIHQHAQFASGILKNQRDIWVYLPPCYRRSTSCRYPVFYLHDGQNVFDAATAFGGTEWNADEAAEELINRGLIEPFDNRRRRQRGRRSNSRVHAHQRPA